MPKLMSSRVRPGFRMPANFRSRKQKRLWSEGVCLSIEASGGCSRQRSKKRAAEAASPPTVPVLCLNSIRRGHDSPNSDLRKCLIFLGFVGWCCTACAPELPS
jgi:hypothetical protein